MMTRAHLHNAHGQAGTDRDRASSGVFAGKLPVATRRPALDPHGMHREFPAIWGRYLRDHYGARRGLIMDVFGVDDRTVRAWLDGLNAPKGSVVALAAALDPAFGDLLRAAA